MSEIVEILSENRAVKGLAYPIEVKVYDGGTQKVPSSITITIKDPDGTTVIDEAAMTAAESGTLTYTLAATKTADLWENAWMEISYTYLTVVRKAIFYFDVVNNILKCSVITANLQKYHPQILSEIWSGTSNFSNQIQKARELVERDLKDKGYRPDLLVDHRQTQELVEYKTLELIFFDFYKSEEDMWFSKYKEVKQIYEDRFSKLQIKYDVDEDIMSEEGEKELLGQIEFKR